MFHRSLTRIAKRLTGASGIQITTRQQYVQQPWIRTARCWCSTSCQEHKPLEGIRVLDLTRIILAGPFCTMLLGDLGAEVIKVERPNVGDDTRDWGPPFVGDQSCYFLSINRNKKSIGVNLQSPRGKQVIHDLATKADVVIENYLPGKLDELGIGYEALRKVAPSIIYCSITGYGSDGPYSKRGGYDVVGAALSGLLHITGPQDGDPCRVGVAMTDMTTGLYAHGAIMAALLQRHKTGQGQKIDCNLLSSQVSLMTHIAANYLIAGQEARRWGTGHESIVPYQAFKTKDEKYLIVGAGNNNLFEKLYKVIDGKHLFEDSRYQDNQLRVKNRTSLIASLSEIFAQKECSVWMEIFEGSGLPCGPVQNMEQVFNDPQVIHNNMIQDIQHSTAGHIRLPGPAVKYSTIDNTQCTPPPRLCEHTEEVLQRVLGYSQEHIQQLHQDGAIELLKQAESAG